MLDSKAYSMLFGRRLLNIPPTWTLLPYCVICKLGEGLQKRSAMCNPAIVDAVAGCACVKRVQCKSLQPWLVPMTGGYEGGGRGGMQLSIVLMPMNLSAATCCAKTETLTCPHPQEFLLLLHEWGEMQSPDVPATQFVYLHTVSLRCSERADGS